MERESTVIAIYLPPGKVDFFTRGFFWAEELRDEVKCYFFARRGLCEEGKKVTFDRWSVATKPKKSEGKKVNLPGGRYTVFFTDQP